MNDKLNIQGIRRVQNLFKADKSGKFSENKLAKQKELIDFCNRLFDFIPDACWLTEAILAKQLGVSIRQIKYAKAYLVESGKIQIRLQPNGKRANHKHYIYKIARMDKDVKEFDKQSSIKWEILNDFLPQRFNQMAIQEQLEIYQEMQVPFIPLHFPKFKKGKAYCSCLSGKNCESIGKHPAVKYNEFDFSDKLTLTKMRLQWEDRDNRFNVGFLTNDFTVIDIDFRKGGGYGLEFLEETYGELPRGLMVKTGNGFHFYTSSVTESSVNLLGHSGIDVRSKGGIVVAPFSNHHSGKSYEWQSISVPEPLPENLLNDIQPEVPKILGERAVSKIALPKENESFYQITKGERNETLFKIAARERGKGKNYYQILDFLKKINVEKCNPPYPQRLIPHIVKSVCLRYEPNAFK